MGNAIGRVGYCRSMSVTLRKFTHKRRPLSTHCTSSALLILPSTMAPKKTTSPPLSDPERALLDSAARILTALQYKEDHPEQDFPHFNENIGTEMVRGIQASKYIRTNHIQTHILRMYTLYPPPENNPHRVHAAVAAVLWEYQVSQNEKRTPNYEAITTRMIAKRIDAIKKSFPLWPMVLKATNLSSKMMERPDLIWWLPKSEEEEKEKEKKAEDGEEDGEEEEEEEEEEAEDAKEGNTAGA